MAKPLVERKADPAAAISFLTVAVLGIAFIVTSKALSLPPFVVTGVPVGLMILYAVLAAMFRRLRLRDDQIGDNLYYMGFTYTLVSLGMSLYQYSSGQSVDDIVRNFGVAVASTIAGIVLRILFNQLRRDPIEFEHISRLDLAEASRRVRRELDGVHGELAHFRRTNMQMLDEAFHEMKTQVSDLSGKTQEITTALTLAAHNLEQVSRSLGKSADLVGERVRGTEKEDNEGQFERVKPEKEMPRSNWAPDPIRDR
jgi:methyl-accepting chemotaxis protein